MNGEELIKSLASSAHRREILFSLMDSPKPLRDLQSIVNASPSVLAHALSYLEEENLVEREKGTRSWRLTNTGLIAAKVLKSAMEAFHVLEKFEDFWLEHEVSWLDDELIFHLGKLKNTELFAYDGINYPHVKYVDEIRNARWLKGVSGMVLKDYMDVYPELVEKGVEIELILSEEVLDYVRGLLRESFGVTLGEYLDAHPNVRVFKLDFKPSVAFTVTDTYFSLGCFTVEGIYDLNTDIMGWDEDSVSFGLMLFERYRSRAKEVRE